MTPREAFFLAIMLLKTFGQHGMASKLENVQEAAEDIADFRDRVRVAKDAGEGLTLTPEETKHLNRFFTKVERMF